MKNMILFGLVLLFSLNNFAQEQVKESKKLTVEINYFHRTQRCATCMSIQENVQKVLDLHFADEINSGKLSFHIVNYEEMEDKDKIEKYEVEGPTLLITRIKKGKEKTKDLTDLAFENSLHHEQKFMDGFQEELNDMFR